ncbi:GerAB/ArcD/ProY family transporter [Paenibacillus sp. J22TS3]|uniref:GerAB/ArcD/ProY family transporter n=1 Tax=Paenibacillus sp. J22TS3 TaxID=2807192 RepID=UPI001B10C360|nr:GerAB/ArcD/ProY family transporter [Paenibacillus sp. J22TS3]GIP23754.1 hypothetical protein J22TS3_40290 [Paenibacillus sp. J22TS3]
MRTTSFQMFRFATIYMLTIPLAFMIPPLITTSGYQGWIPILIGGAINMVLIFCTYKLGIFTGSQSWTEAGEKIAGKWGHRIVLLLLVLWSIYYVSLDIEQFTLFYGTVYMRETPSWFLNLFIGLITMITARWGFSTLIYIGDASFIILVLATLFILYILAGDADYQMLSALLTHFDTKILAKDVLNVISWIGEWFVFLFITPHLVFKKTTLRNLLLGNVVVVSTVLITWMLVLLNLGPHFGSMVKYPVLELIRGTSFTGLVGNADPVFIGLWGTSMIVHDALLLYVGATCLSHLLKFKEKVPLIILLAGTSVVAAFQYNRNISLFQSDVSQFGYSIYWVVINGIPIYYVLLALVRGQFRKKKIS